MPPTPTPTPPKPLPFDLGILSQFADLLKTIGGTAGNAALSGLTSLSKAFGQMGGAVAGGMKTALDKTREDMRVLGGIISEGWKKTGADVRALVGVVGTGISEAWKKTGISIRDTTTWITGGISEGWKKLKIDLSNPVVAINGIMGSLVSGLVSLGKGVVSVAGTVAGRVGGFAKTVASRGFSLAKKGAKAVGGAAAGGAVAMGAKLAGAVMQPLKALEAGIGRVNSAVASYVALANPGVLQKWTMATEDLQATIGRSLTPVLDAATTVVREIGGALNAAAPAFEGVFDVFRSAEFKAAVADFGKILAGVLTHVGQAFSALAKALMPLIPVISMVLDVVGGLVSWVADIITDLAPAIGDILKLLVAVIDVLKPIFDVILDVFKNFIGIQLRLLAGILQIILPPLTELIKLLAEFTKWVMGLIRQLLEFIGIDFGNETPKAETKSNVGMAARQATFSDPAASLKTAITQAFSIGLGANQTPAETTAKAATGIRGTLSKFFAEFWGKIGDLLWKLAKDIGQFFLDLPGQIADAMNPLKRGQSQGAKNLADAIDPKQAQKTGQGLNAGAGAVFPGLQREPAEPVQNGEAPQAEGNPLRHFQDMARALQENTKALKEKNAAPPNAPPIAAGPGQTAKENAERSRATTP